MFDLKATFYWDEPHSHFNRALSALPRWQSYPHEFLLKYGWGLALHSRKEVITLTLTCNHCVCPPTRSEPAASGWSVSVWRSHSVALYWLRSRAYTPRLHPWHPSHCHHLQAAAAYLCPFLELIWDFFGRCVKSDLAGKNKMVSRGISRAAWCFCFHNLLRLERQTFRYWDAEVEPNLNLFFFFFLE